MLNRLSRLVFLLLSSLLLQNVFSQDLILRTANDSLSIAGIASCKEPSCISYSAKVVTNAIKNARLRADDILSERDDLQEKITRYNEEVSTFYKTVDSLGDLYAKNQKELEEYSKERKNFSDTYRFMGSTQPTVPSMPSAGTTRSSQSQSQTTVPGGGSINSNMANANTRIQRDLDDKALAEKGRRLNSEHRQIDDKRKILERKRTQLLAEGNYLNEMLQKNTDILTEANKRMIEVLAFGKRAIIIFTDELKSPQKLDIVMLQETESFTNSLSARILETQPILVNKLQKK